MTRATGHPLARRPKNKRQQLKQENQRTELEKLVHPLGLGPGIVVVVHQHGKVRLGRRRRPRARPLDAHDRDAREELAVGVGLDILADRAGGAAGLLDDGRHVRRRRGCRGGGLQIQPNVDRLHVARRAARVGPREIARARDKLAARRGRGRHFFDAPARGWEWGGRVRWARWKGEDVRKLRRKC